MVCNSYTNVSLASPLAADSETASRYGGQLRTSRLARKHAAADLLVVFLAGWGGADGAACIQLQNAPISSVRGSPGKLGLPEKL